MERIIALYIEYIELIRTGKSHDEAFIEFQYLHPITLSRLDSYIKKENKRVDSSLSLTLSSTNTLSI